MLRLPKNPGLQIMKNMLLFPYVVKKFTLFHKKNSWKKRVHVRTALQRIPRWKLSRAERDMYGADGRWLQRGAAEKKSRLRRDRLL